MGKEWRWFLAAMIVGVVIHMSLLVALAIDRRELETRVRDYVKLCAMVADTGDDFEMCIRVAEGGSADE